MDLKRYDESHVLCYNLEADMYLSVDGSGIYNISERRKIRQS